MKLIVKVFPEITIKSRPVRTRFIRQLAKNIRAVLRDLDPAVVVNGVWDNLELETRMTDAKALKEYKVGANQVDAQGFLPNELKRQQRALSYHNYALPPLSMIASFALVNGVDLRQENNGALKRLGDKVLADASVRSAGSPGHRLD